MSSELTAGPFTRPRLASDLSSLGIGAGDTLLLHASLRSVGFVVGGAVAVVQALLDVLGPSGTLVVPTMTAGNSDPRRWASTVRDPVPASWWQTIRDHLPAFDADLTPSVGMGAIAEVVRTWPEASRSSHPQTSFAAIGAAADHITSVHPIDCHLGPQSPLGRLHAMGGARVLLLGVGYDVCTTFHLAEYQWPGNDDRDYECAIAEGDGRRWYAYRDVNLDAGDFGVIGRDLERARGMGLLARGRIGSADSRLLDLHRSVKFATMWMMRHRRARRTTKVSRVDTQSTT